MNDLVNGEDNNAEANWTPPTEAELKVLEAKRERNNKISTLMGQYLLRGYKMLSTSCPYCDCILLEDRQKKKYCIACYEVDADTKKDNPAVSEHAARSMVEESQHRHSSDSDEIETFTLVPNQKTTYRLDHKKTVPQDNKTASETGSVPKNASSPSTSGAAKTTTPRTTISSTTTTHTSSNARTRSGACQTSQASQAGSASFHQREISPTEGDVIKKDEVDFSLNNLKQKLVWATNRLKHSTNIQECIHLVKLISEIASAMKSIQEIK